MTYESTSLFEMDDSDLAPATGLVAILAVNIEIQPVFERNMAGDQLRQKEFVERDGRQMHIECGGR